MSYCIGYAGFERARMAGEVATSVRACATNSVAISSRSVSLCQSTWLSRFAEKIEREVREDAYKVPTSYTVPSWGNRGGGIRCIRFISSSSSGT